MTPQRIAATYASHQPPTVAHEPPQVRPKRIARPPAWVVVAAATVAHLVAWVWGLA